MPSRCRCCCCSVTPDGRPPIAAAAPASMSPLLLLLSSAALPQVPRGSAINAATNFQAISLRSNRFSVDSSRARCDQTSHQVIPVSMATSSGQQSSEKSVRCESTKSTTCLH
ncbi:hypothetical protein NL676_014444 [Syzygium grande]|nr:hypothetical protein NL676_014444 [Syzygium grande]